MTDDFSTDIVSFFNKILPSGILCIATALYRNGDMGFWRQEAFQGHDDFIAGVARKKLKDPERDLYFALGSLASNSIVVDGEEKIRIKKNIKTLKCFFSDLDVKEGYYDSWQAALEDLKQFCINHSFPKPIIVFSGLGLHVYWPLEDPLSKEDWEPIAINFELILKAAGVKIDTARQKDCASVLRIPNTVNHKHSGSMVRILMDAEEISNEVFFSRIVALSEKFKIPEINRAKRIFSPLSIPGTQIKDASLPQDVVTEYPESDFDKILDNCLQMQDAVRTGCIGEPLWARVLGVCQFTTDPEGSAQRVSENHPEYVKTKTLQKLNNRSAMSGATLCATLDSFNPGLCNSCKHFNLIKSPIVLGYKRNSTVTAHDLDSIIDAEGAISKEKVLEYMPSGFSHRKGSGGILVNGGPEGNKTTVLYPYDFLPKKIIYREKGDSFDSIWEAPIPNHGSKEVTVPNGILSDAPSLTKLLGEKGIVVIPSNKLNMSTYMSKYILELQKLARPHTLLSRQGWRDDNTAFVVQNKLYKSDGTVHHFKMSEDLLNSIPGLGEKGSLNSWVDAIQFYNVAGHEAHRFCLYAAFGSILFHMTGHSGVMVYLSGKSGCGKSTVQKTINSLWGHPLLMLINGTESGMTQNAFYGIMNAYNNLPVCLDEVSKLDAKVFCNLALSVSQGTGKKRSTRTGELSSNTENWANITFSSSNSDAYLTAASQNNDFTAEAMRIFQIRMSLASARSKDEADDFLNNHLMRNYGLAGPRFVAHAVCKYDALKEKIDRSIKSMGNALKVAPQERFWIGLVATAAVAGTHAKKIGLLPNFPIMSDIDWAMAQLRKARDYVGESTVSSKEIVSMFLDSHFDEMLILERSDGDNIRPLRDPRSELSIRFERDTGNVFINTSKFKNFCKEKGLNYAEVEKSLVEEEVMDIKFSGFKVLGAGTTFGTGQTRCILIKAQKLSTEIAIEK